MARKPTPRGPTVKAQDFLLEIGCEELPAEYLPQAAWSLQFSAWCQLAPDVGGYRWRQIETWVSPRRLVLIIRGLEVVVRWEKIGPPASAAYDAQGRPTPAAQGFAISQGVSVEALRLKETPKGPCVVAIHSAPVVPKLATAIPIVVNGVQFPKRMRWGGNFRFARPIRWLVALYGKQVVPCQIADLSSGRCSATLRRARVPWLSLASAADYLRAVERGLRLNGVVSRPAMPPPPRLANRLFPLLIPIARRRKPSDVGSRPRPVLPADNWILVKSSSRGC